MKPTSTGTGRTGEGGVGSGFINEVTLTFGCEPVRKKRNPTAQSVTIWQGGSGARASLFGSHANWARVVFLLTAQIVRKNKLGRFWDVMEEYGLCAACDSAIPHLFL